jgi:hypothetical protein
MRHGDNLPVLYMPYNPNKAMVAKGSAGVVILIAIGVFLFVLGVGHLRTYKMYIPQAKTETSKIKTP